MTTLISTLENGKAEFFTLLHKHMEEKGDFPALSKSVQTFSATIQNEDVSITDITGIILSDFALTQKVIRLANSAMYASIDGEITTISKAAMIIGLDALSYLVLNIRLVDTFSISASDSAAARSEMVKALLAGDIAREVAAKTRIKNVEEAVVCALMHHLGRLLVVFYFPEEWPKIKEISVSKSLSENEAAAEVIGITLDEISQQIAKTWQLPRKICNSMLSPTSVVETSIPGSPGWLKMMACFAGEAAATVTKKDADGGLVELASFYSNALLIPVETITDSVSLAINGAIESSILEGVSAPHGKPTDSVKKLIKGTHDVNDALAKGENFGSVLNLSLETMYSSMGFNRVAAFLRDGHTFRGKVGFGNAMPEVLSNLYFPEAHESDVFHLSLVNNADVCIEEISGKSAAGIPAWLIETLPDVRAFILLPMNLNGRPIGLLYGDWKKGTTELIKQSEMALLRSLRDSLMKSLGSK